MFLVPVTRESRQLARLQSRLIDDTIDRLFGSAADTENVAARSPALDVVEAPTSYTVKLEVPGVSKEDIDRKSTRLNSSHVVTSRMPSSA